MPRVGGSDDDGVWTGLGLNEEGLEPCSTTCYRAYYDSDLKASRAAKDNDKQAQLGLRAQSKNLFCRSTEGNTNGASVLKDLHMLMQEHGFEGVFIIRTRSGATINMFKTPGLVTENMIANWVADLLQRGVWDDNGYRRLPLCPWDMLICKLAFRTIINSCSDALRQDFIDRTDPEKRVGPWTLFIMMTKVYRPDLTKLENLKKALKALSILSFEAQSVTLYKQSASALVREIQMISTTEHPIPDLAIATIAGLAASGVTKFHLSVTSKMTELNRKPTDARDAQVALNLLDDFEAEYISLVQMNLYPPALKPDAETQKYKAMQAEVSYLKQEMAKLSQDRTAGSTHGNQNITKVGPHIKCFTCGGNHLQQDHDKAVGTDTNPSQSTDAPRHGLSEDTAKKCNEAIAAKVKTMPAFVNIPDDAKYSIEVNGTTCAKFCRHCLRFVKGTNQHYTTEHKGRSRVRYQAPTDSSPPPAATPAAAAPAPAAATPAASTDGSAKVAAAAPPSSSGLVRFGPSTSYDLGYTPPSVGGFMARLSDNESNSSDDNDEYDSDYSLAFLDARESLND